MPRSGREKAEGGDSAARTVRDMLQRGASGIGKGEKRGSTSAPLAVHIVDDTYYDKVAKALGVSGAGGAHGIDGLSQQFKVLIEGQKAALEVQRQMVTSLNNVLRGMSNAAPKTGSESRSSTTSSRGSTSGFPTRPMGYHDSPVTGDHATRFFGGYGGGYGGYGGGYGFFGPQQDFSPLQYHQNDPRSITRFSVRAPGSNTSIGQIRGGIQEALGNSIHQRWGLGDRKTATPVRQYDDDGNMTGYRMLRHGEYEGDLIPHGTDAFKEAGEAEAKMSRASTLGGSIAEGGIKGVIRRFPMASAAATAVTGAVDLQKWLIRQRQANSQYQQIYGGANMGGLGSLGGFFQGAGYNGDSGMSNRMAEQGYQLKNFFSGTFTGDDAEKAFRGVSSLGYRGDQRSSSLSFMENEYKKLGMGVEDSMKLVQISASHAQTSLSEVSKGLDSVTESASATGQSAKDLRDQFTNNFAIAQQQGFGSGSAAIATANTNAYAGANRQLQNVNISSGMQANMAMKYAVASQVGMTPDQVRQGVAHGGASTMLRAQSKVAQQMLGSAVPKAAFDAMNQSINREGGADKVRNDPGAQNNVVQSLIDNGANSDVVAQTLNNMGIDTSNMDPNKIMLTYANTVGTKNLDAQANKLDQKHSIGQLSAEDQKNLGQRPSLGGNITTSGPSGSMSTPMPAQGTEFSRNYLKGLGTDKNGTGIESAQAYQDLQKKTKSTDPAIEAAIKKFGNDSNVGFSVMTGNGRKVVSLKDAVANYSDQLSTGKATVVGGGDDNNGKMLNAITGVTDTGVTPGKGGIEDSSTKKDGPGQNIEDFKKDHGIQDKHGQDDPGKGDQHVMIGFTDEARRLFRQISSSDVDSANANGTVPNQGTLGGGN